MILDVANANVYPILRCKRCGVAGSPKELAFNDVKIADIVACGRCIDEIEGRLASVRPIHSAMLACGVPADAAGDAMYWLLLRLDGQKAWPLKPGAAP